MADVVLQVGDLDSGDALQGAVARPAIRMILKGDFQQFAAGQRIRIGGFAPQARHDLRANAFDIAALEARRGQRHPEQVEGFVSVIPEHAQRTAEIVPRRTEAQFDGAALETLVERLGIQIARTFIEQIGDHVADAGLVGRILRGAAAEGILHREQRHGRILHKPGLDASRRNQMLDFCGGVRGRRRQRRHREAGSQHECRAARAGPEIVHERFSSRFGAASLIR